jgi:hypothetical protein
MRPNKKEPESAPFFWFQIEFIYVGRMAASYRSPVWRLPTGLAESSTGFGGR